MAVITASHLDGGAVGSGTSQATSSISPGANRLVLVAVESRFSGGTVNTPTVTGASMTWTSAVNLLSADNHSRLTLFRALAASPGTGALTLDFAGQTQEFINWEIDQFRNVDTSGSNGANAIVQNATALSTATVTGITVTLAAFSATSNATYGIVATNQNNTISVGASFTLLADNGSTGETNSEFAGSNQTSVNWTWASASPIALAIALELKAGSFGGFLTHLI